MRGPGLVGAVWTELASKVAGADKSRALALKKLGAFSVGGLSGSSGSGNDTFIWPAILSVPLPVNVPPRKVVVPANVNRSVTLGKLMTAGLCSKNGAVQVLGHGHRHCRRW